MIANRNVIFAMSLQLSLLSGIVLIVLVVENCVWSNSYRPGGSLTVLLMVLSFGLKSPVVVRKWEFIYRCWVAKLVENCLEYKDFGRLQTVFHTVQSASKHRSSFL